MKKLLNKIVAGAVTAVYTASLLIGTMPAALAADTEEYPYPSLWKAYSDCFDISVAVEPSDLTLYPELAKEQFNVIVPENQMKAWMHKSEDENSWYWTGADNLLAFAEKNGKKFRMHTLVCPDQYDGYGKNELKWFYCDRDGNSLFDENGAVINPETARELTLERLENHIKTIMERYKGRIYAYDVVNEAYKEGGAERTYTKFAKLLDGVDWITKCFEWAHECDPDAVLIYNDNGFTTDIKKQNVIYEKIKTMREAGIPVQIGMQMHYNTADLELGSVRNLLEKFSGLCDIYITELDMGTNVKALTGNVVKDNSNHDCNEIKTVLYPDYMYDEASEVQARKYAGLFDLFREYSDSIKAVGFWNICDGRTYRGTSSRPLVFDENGDPKAAFYRILDFDKKLPREDATNFTTPYRNIDYEVDRENGKVIVRGETSAQQFLYLTLYNSGYDADTTDAEINNKVTTKVSGKFTEKIDINPDSTAKDRYYEYTLAVKVGITGVEKKVTFNYYTDEEVKDGFVIHDPLNDFSKMYSVYNINLNSNIDFYEQDTAGIGVTNGYFLSGASTPPLVGEELQGSYAVYKIPDGFVASDITVDSFPYESTLWDSKKPKPDIYGSQDGVTYTKISDDSTTWGSEIAKVWKKDAVMAKQRRHFIGNVNNLDSGIKYIKLDLSRFTTNWHIYIGDVKITVKPDPNYTAPQKAELEISDTGIYTATSHGGILSGLYHSGGFDARTTVTNNTDSDKKIMFVAAEKMDGVLSIGKSDTQTIAAGDTADFAASLDPVITRYGDTAELFVFDVTDGKLTPLTDKKKYDTLTTPDMYFKDDFENFDKMNAHSDTLELLDGTASSFSDTTLIQQTGDWKGGYIEYKAEEGKTFRNVKMTIYTDLQGENYGDAWGNIPKYGAPYISVSEDGVNYTDIVGGKSANVSFSAAGWIDNGRGGSTYGTAGYWFRKRIAQTEIPGGAKYVRFGFAGPLFSKHHIKLGGIEMLCDEER